MRYAGMIVFLFLTVNLSFSQPFHVKDNVPLSTVKKEYIENEILVKFKSGIPKKAIKAMNGFAMAVVKEIGKKIPFHRLRIPKNRTVEEMVEIYSKNPIVEWAEPNYIASTCMTPNDKYYEYQWHFLNGDGGVKMESAWDIVPGGDSNVIVAVIDAGVAYEDYSDDLGTYQLAPDLEETNFVPGYDFHNDDTHPNDDNGHGTHVAGTIAQSTNNDTGVAGIAYGVSIMPIKVLSSEGSGSYDNIAQGIIFAADSGADVINMSLGGSNNSSVLEDACAYAYEKGVTIIAAAGNDGDRDVTNYPAAYDDYVIAVAASDYNGDRASYSTKGDYVDITAPGGDTKVDENDDGYADGVLQMTFADGDPTDFGYYFYQGTSMASPHIAGVAALLVSQGVNDPDNIREALQNSAKDINEEGWDEETGWGLLDAPAALDYFSEPVHDVAVESISAPSIAETDTDVSLDVTVVNQGGYSESFTVNLTDKTDNETLPSQTVADLLAGDTTTLTFVWNSGTTTGNHTLEAEAVLEEDSEPADNIQQHIILVSEPVHDLAVISIDVDETVTINDEVPVTVGVENQGTFTENSVVALYADDGTNERQIGEDESVNLEAGESTTLNFSWTPEALGVHTLTANVSEVEGEVDLDDNSLSATSEVNEPQIGYVYVTSIEMKPKKVKFFGRIYFKSVEATITVVDNEGSPVPGALVYGQWSGATGDTDSGETGEYGNVVFVSDQIITRNRNTFTITITDIQGTELPVDLTIGETTKSISF